MDIILDQVLVKDSQKCTLNDKKMLFELFLPHNNLSLAVSGYNLTYIPQRTITGLSSLIVHSLFPHWQSPLHQALPWSFPLWSKGHSAQELAWWLPQLTCCPPESQRVLRFLIKFFYMRVSHFMFNIRVI